MKHALLVGALLGLAGCSTLSEASCPVEAPPPVGSLARPSFSCEGARYTREPRHRADVPMGRLEVKKLSAVLPPKALPPEETPASGRAPGRRPALPQAQLRVVAEAVPLGTLTAALSQELGIGIVVAPELVDVRVSLSLPDTTAEEVFAALFHQYDVERTGEDGHRQYGPQRPDKAPLIVLEDRLEVLRRRYEAPEIITRVLSVKGLPAEQVASAYCKQLASEYGAATVIGEALLVKDLQVQHERLEALLRALRGQESAPAS